IGSRRRRLAARGRSPRRRCGRQRGHRVRVARQHDRAPRSQTGSAQRGRTGRSIRTVAGRARRHWRFCKACGRRARQRCGTLSAGRVVGPLEHVSDDTRSNAMSAVVSLQNVVKAYTRGKQTVEALHHLTLAVEEGDFVALMGPSGSGKTTVLNMIGGIDYPTSGEVVVAGERIDLLRGGRLARWRANNIGFVFQFYNLMPMLNAERNVELPLLLTSLSSQERKRNVHVALSIVGLEDRTRHKPSELSGGQAQRVALARALV